LLQANLRQTGLLCSSLRCAPLQQACERIGTLPSTGPHFAAQGGETPVYQPRMRINAADKFRRKAIAGTEKSFREFPPSKTPAKSRVKPSASRKII